MWGDGLFVGVFCREYFFWSSERIRIIQSTSWNAFCRPVEGRRLSWPEMVYLPTDTDTSPSINRTKCWATSVTSNPFVCVLSTCLCESVYVPVCVLGACRARHAAVTVEGIRGKPHVVWVAFHWAWCFSLNKVSKVKSFPSHNAHRAALISVSLAFSQTLAYTARPRIQASVSRGVPVHSLYSPAFAGTHCAYPRRDGQAELTLGGWLHTKMVYPSADGHPTKY